MKLRVLAGALIATLATAGLSGCPCGPTGPLALALVEDGFQSPIYATSPPGDVARLFVVEQTGRIWIIKDGARLAAPFLDISAKLGASGGERGLLGLVFHPNYFTNGYFYINYTNEDSDPRVARYSVTQEADIADPASEQIVIEFPDDPFPNHNGGMLAFGPDGYLYIGMGDGGSGNDPNNNAQNLNVLLGKLLRVDVNGQAPYTIPADNPFVGNENTRGEIWAYGLRNPWRYSFDRESGDLYIGDVGQSAREEVDFQPGESNGGENYGWRNREGTICRPGEENCTLPDAVEPIHDYDKLITQAVVGGYVYRGDAIPGWEGTYFFGDYSSGEVWTLRYDGATVTEFVSQPALSPPGILPQVSSFGEDGRGELYVVDYRGAIYKIIAAPVAE